MEFNSDKFEFIKYRPPTRNSSIPPTQYTSNDGSQIEEKQSLRDLGITISNDLSFSPYIQAKCSSVRGTIAWVLRTFRTRQLAPMLTLWKQLIRCHIEYCFQLWSPKLGDIQLIESLQASFLRHISLHGLDYWECLSKLGMYSLERCREWYTIIHMWRIFENHAPNLSATPISCATNPRTGRSCAVPRTPANVPAKLRTIRDASFAVRGPMLFNSLPRDIRNMSGCDINTFKAKLDRYLKTVPDEPRIQGMTLRAQLESNSLIHWSPWMRLHQPHDAGLVPAGASARRQVRVSV